MAAISAAVLPRRSKSEAYWTALACYMAVMTPNDDQHREEIRALARRFAREEIAPNAAAWDENATFPHEAVKRMADVGLLGMTAPARYGGSDADSIALAIAVEEIARADATCALVLSMLNSLAILTLTTFGTEKQREQWLPGIVTGDTLACFAISEPHAGSNAAAMRTFAMRSGEHYLINGTKQFISMGSVSRLAFVFAVTERQQGTKGMSCFLIPTDTKGFRVARKEQKMGIRASDTCQIALDDLEVHESQMLGEPGDGYRIALHGLGASRIGIAAQATGVAAAAFADAAAYAREREAFGHPIIEHQGVGFKLADVAAEVHAARLMTRHAAGLKDAGMPYATYAAMAKLYAAEMCERACSAAIQTFGGYGYMKGMPIERRYRDARAFQIYEGTSEIQRVIITRAIARDELNEP